MTNTIMVILVLLVAVDTAIGIYSRRVSNNMYYNLAEKQGKTRGDLLTLMSEYKSQKEEIVRLKDEIQKLRNKK